MSYKLEIYINQQAVDTDKGTKFSMNLKGTDISNLTTRSISYTGIIKIPFTPTNDEIYGRARLIGSTTTIPYALQSIEIRINGVAIITDGVHYLSKASSAYELRVLTNQAEFFNTIKGKKLNELDFTDLNGVYSLDNTCNKNNGVVSPAMDYGNMSGTDVKAATYLPSIFWATIIGKIFINNGFTKFGGAFANWKHLKTFMPYSKDAWEYTEKFASDRSIQAISNITQGPWALNATLSELDTVNFNSRFGPDPLSLFDYANERYEIQDPDATDGAVIAYADHTISFSVVVSGGTVGVSLFEEGGSSLGLFAVGLGTGDHTLTLSDKAIRNNHYLKIVMITDTGTPTVTLTAFRWILNAQRTPGAFLYFQELMPDINQIDLIKEFAMLNGVVFDGAGGHINCYRLEDIINQTVPTVGPLDEWEEGDQAPGGVGLSWTLGSAPSVFTSLTYPRSKYLWFPYPTRKTRTYRATYNIDFGVNGTNVYIIFLDEFGNESTTAPIPIYNTGVNAGTLDIFSTGNGVYAALYVGTGGINETTIINSLTFEELDPEELMDDWTDKRVRREHDQIDYSGLGYSQQNIFQFGNVDSVPQEYLWKASLDVANTVLPLSRDLFTSIFSSSNFGVNGTLISMLVDVYDSGTVTKEFDRSPGLRLGVVRQNRSTDPATITFNTAQSVYKVGVWSGASGDMSLRPEFLISESYGALQRALQKMKVVTRAYNLNLVDISKFKYSKLVIDDDGIYLKLSSGIYNPGSSLEVTLLKV